MKMPTTNFLELYDEWTCPSLKKLTAYLGGIHKYGADTPITLLQILDSNGLDEALWTLRICDKSKELSWRILFDYLRHALCFYEIFFPEDPEPHYALYILERYVKGHETQEELYSLKAPLLKSFRNIHSLPPEKMTQSYRPLVLQAQRAIDNIFNLLSRLKYDAMKDVRTFLYDVHLGFGKYEEEWQEKHLRKLLEEAD